MFRAIVALALTAHAAASCVNDECWFSKKPGKDCAWVAAKPEKRCKGNARGEDGVSWQIGGPLVWESCLRSFFGDFFAFGRGSKNGLQNRSVFWARGGSKKSKNGQVQTEQLVPGGSPEGFRNGA